MLAACNRQCYRAGRERASTSNDRRLASARPAGREPQVRSTNEMAAAGYRFFRFSASASSATVSGGCLSAVTMALSTSSP